MAFYRRRPRPDAEKCADPAKARASALETLAGQEVSANILYERLCRRYTEQAAAAAVAEMVQLDYVNDARYAEARAHSLLAARKSRRAAAQSLRQKGLAPAEVAGALEAVYAPEDGGDDPDITTGSEVRAHVRLMESDGGIRFLAGDGVGTITLPGMKLPVGEAAINPVPRRMIEQAVRQVFPARAAEVTVSIPGGEELAKRTFNPRLGVVGGLSVLGTTGVVRPMSEEALKETIRLELSVRKSQGAEEIGLVFGSQGERAANALFPCMQAVQMSNFVGFALDCAAELGFACATLLGQPGKLVKVSGGSMQTHSQYGDGRRETLIAHLALMGAPVELLEFVRQSVTLDGCISPIYDAGFDAVWTHLADAAAAYAAARIHGEMRVDAVMLDAKGQILGRSTSL